MERNNLITLGGGCFWCLEAVYQDLKGVTSVISGYAGGHIENPDYESVCQGVTGHAEVVQIYFNPEEISLRNIFEVFFVIHDPTTMNRQGHDVGTQYRSVIYAENEDQLKLAREVIAELETQQAYAGKVVTELQLAPQFYKAEEYHQNYFVNHPFQGYCMGVVAPKLEKFRKTFKELSRK